jgi:GNAT superfamily N-acetyltransferase
VRIEVKNSCNDFTGYRAARVKSLFNVESGANFEHTADLQIDDDNWKVGLVVGPSGSGKTSIGRSIFGPEFMHSPVWPENAPIIDAVLPGGDFDAATASLSAVGLGSVPSWLRPYRVLSNGEKFRADLARLVSDAPARAVVDEFTSVVDRQIAKVGALAFQKAWRRTAGKVVLLSCHYDIIDWLEPDWVYDTATGKYAGRGLWRRPKINVGIWQTDWRYWHIFEPHHYLKVPRVVAAFNYVAVVDGTPIAHIAFSTRPGLKEARACRMVVMPEWQGAGVGMRFLNATCEAWLTAANPYSKPMRTLFHTSHPGLCAALRRDQKWRQISAVLYGESKKASRASMRKTIRPAHGNAGTGYGGHLRAVQGFRYYGAAGVAAAKKEAP